MGTGSAASNWSSWSNQFALPAQCLNRLREQQQLGAILPNLTEAQILHAYTRIWARRGTTGCHWYWASLGFLSMSCLLSLLLFGRNRFWWACGLSPGLVFVYLLQYLACPPCWWTQGTLKNHTQQWQHKLWIVHAGWSDRNFSLRTSQNSPVLIWCYIWSTNNDIRVP